MWQMTLFIDISENSSILPDVDGRLVLRLHKKHHIPLPKLPLRSFHQHSENAYFSVTLAQNHFLWQKAVYRSNDMTSEQSVSLFVSEYLHKSICIAVGFGARIGNERKLANVVRNILQKAAMPHPFLYTITVPLF